MSIFRVEKVTFESNLEAVVWILANKFTTRYYEGMSVTKKIEQAEKLITELTN